MKEVDTVIIWLPMKFCLIRFLHVIIYFTCFTGFEHLTKPLLSSPAPKPLLSAKR